MVIIVVILSIPFGFAPTVKRSGASVNFGIPFRKRRDCKFLKIELHFKIDYFLIFIAYEWKYAIWPRIRPELSRHRNPNDHNGLEQARIGTEKFHRVVGGHSISPQANSSGNGIELTYMIAIP